MTYLALKGKIKEMIRLNVRTTAQVISVLLGQGKITGDDVEAAFGIC